MPLCPGSSQRSLGRTHSSIPCGAHRISSVLSTGGAAGATLPGPGPAVRPVLERLVPHASPPADADHEAAQERVDKQKLAYRRHRRGICTVPSHRSHWWVGGCSGTQQPASTYAPDASPLASSAVGSP